MTGNQLVLRTRHIIRDYETTFRKGLFWKDDDVLLCLNAAQMIVLNACLNENKRHWLRGLVSETSGASPLPLPEDYYHAFAATANGKKCQVYMGREGTPYNPVYHHGVWIFQHEALLSHQAAPLTPIVLFYYRYPKPIVADDEERKDFERVVYDVILNTAIPLLGIKETQTQRDARKYGRASQSITIA